jgi:signal transduction histidine kinase
MDGYEVCTRLKADPNLRDIPVLFLSALSDLWDKARAFQVGGVDYITKPFQLEDVEARVRAHLRLRQLQRELANHNARLESTVQERTHELAEANKRLSRLDRAKSDFLAIISHELRTPLNGLFGVGQLLFMDLPENPTNEGYRKIFNDSQQRILDLVDDALLLTQMETSPEQYALETSPLDDVLKQAVANASATNQDSGVTLGIAPPAAGKVVGKPNLLAKAISSLLLTAVKFSRRGGFVTTTMITAPDGQLLCIEAGGRIIPPERLPNFFDALAIGTTISAGGDLGLMPAVAQSLLKAFGGQVTVENLSPPGVRFSVRLQAAPAA